MKGYKTKVKKRIAIITNIPAPYRVDLFYYLQTHVNNMEFHVVYTSKTEDNRIWSIDKKKLLNTYILNSKVLVIKGRLDNRYIHIPTNIWKVLSTISPDIVIAFEYNLAALQSLCWCKKKRKKFIHLTDGTLFSERNIGKIQKISRRIITKYADACIASSTKAREKLIDWGVPKEKIFVSLLTVDTEKYRSVCKKTEYGRILYVGSTIKRKGLDLLIHALGEVKNNFELRIVGNGRQEEINKLKKLAIDNKIDGKLTWCGYKEGEALLEEYGRAEIFVLPTREDCFGLVLLEAMCAKLPIISSKYADGVYDIVENGINGYIIDPFNQNEFAETISKAIGDSDLQKRAQKVDCTKFDFSEVIKGYISAIDYCNR